MQSPDFAETIPYHALTAIYSHPERQADSLKATSKLRAQQALSILCTPSLSKQSGPVHAIFQALAAIFKPLKAQEIFFNPFPKHDLGAFDIICYPPDFLVFCNLFSGLPSRCSCLWQRQSLGLSSKWGVCREWSCQLRLSLNQLIFDV